MSAPAPASRHAESQTACVPCLRRAWLLASLSGPLDRRARDRSRLLDAMGLSDADLIGALAGRRARELGERYERFRPQETGLGSEIEQTCRHRHGHPRTLLALAEAPMLELAGGAEQLRRLAAGPVVAIVGSRTPSDYGVQVVRTLVRELSACGIAVAASLHEGIASEALGATRQVGGSSIAVSGSGLGATARRGARRRERDAHGCTASELPWDCPGRHWGAVACERILVALAGLVLVVEARLKPGDLAPARLARALGRPVAAVPGRVTSPLSRGSHALLGEDAHLVTETADLLDLLDRLDPSTRPPEQARPTPALDLGRRLQRVLDLVGDGWDTPGKLALGGIDADETLLALSELELLGLVARSETGRYVPRSPLSRRERREDAPVCRIACSADRVDH